VPLRTTGSTCAIAGPFILDQTRDVGVSLVGQLGSENNARVEREIGWCDASGVWFAKLMSREHHTQKRMRTSLVAIWHARRNAVSLQTEKALTTA
jgi:hypothetical protein